jgi:hypothetical protein
MFGLLLTFMFFYMAYSFISLATKYKYSKRYHTRIAYTTATAAEPSSQEVWDDGEVPWYLKDENNKNNSDNTSVAATPKKPLPIIPTALVIA